MPTFKKDDLTVTTDVPAEMVTLDAQGWKRLDESTQDAAATVTHDAPAPEEKPTTEKPATAAVRTGKGQSK